MGYGLRTYGKTPSIRKKKGVRGTAVRGASVRGASLPQFSRFRRKKRRS